MEPTGPLLKPVLHTPYLLAWLPVDSTTETCSAPPLMQPRSSGRINSPQAKGRLLHPIAPKQSAESFHSISLYPRLSPSLRRPRWLEFTMWLEQAPELSGEVFSSFIWVVTCLDIYPSIQQLRVTCARPSPDRSARFRDAPFTEGRYVRKYSKSRKYFHPKCDHKCP